MLNNVRLMGHPCLTPLFIQNSSDFIYLIFIILFVSLFLLLFSLAIFLILFSLTFLLAYFVYSVECHLEINEECKYFSFHFDISLFTTSSVYIVSIIPFLALKPNSLTSHFLSISFLKTKNVN